MINLTAIQIEEAGTYQKEVRGSRCYLCGEMFGGEGRTADGWTGRTLVLDRRPRKVHRHCKVMYLKAKRDLGETT